MPLTPPQTRTLVCIVCELFTACVLAISQLCNGCVSQHFQSGESCCGGQRRRVDVRPSPQRLVSASDSALRAEVAPPISSRFCTVLGNRNVGKDTLHLCELAAASSGSPDINDVFHWSRAFVQASNRACLSTLNSGGLGWCPLAGTGAPPSERTTAKAARAVVAVDARLAD